MEQYLTHTNYALWEVIVNGDAPTSIASVSGGAEAALPPKTTKQKIAKRNELKEKSTMLLAIPDEHLLKFYGIKDAKTLWEEIKTGFGGNKESKKIQKTILKQQYENFAALISEVAEKSPPGLNIHTLIMQNQSDLDTLSMDDLYNNLKVYEAEIKSQSNSSSNSQNVAFVSSDNTSSTNEVVNTAHDVSAASSQGQAFASTYADDVAILTMRVKRFIKKIRRNLNFNGKETVGFDKTKVKCYNCHRRVETPAKALVVTDGLGYDWSYQAEEGPTDFALMAFSSLGSSNSDTENKAFFKEDISFLKYDANVRDNSITELKNQSEEYLKEKDDLKLKLEKFETSSKNLTNLINSQISLKDKTGLGYDSQLNERDLNNKSDVFESASDSSMNESEENNNQANDRYKVGEGYHAVLPPYTGNFMPPRFNLSFAGLDDSIFNSAICETVTSVPKSETSASKTSKVPVNTAKQSSPRAATSTSIAKYVNTAATRPNVNGANLRSNVFHKSHSPVRKTFNQRTIPKNSDLKETINTAKVNNVTTAGTKAVVSAVQGNRENAVKSSACWIWRQTRNVIDHISKDSGSYILKRFNYVDVQGRLKSRFLTVDALGIGPETSPSLQIIKRLMVDLLHLGEVLKEENNVLFTETECLVLSSDFKLLDENQVLLKVPKQNNMYSFDLKNVAPSGGLTCLFAKAIIDESNLWHRRLGHINFKTMNKLVKGNLVRGLPSKIFENDHTCVTYQKGKQHKASCIENQLNHRVEVIRCDNRAEFKNSKMNQFCQMKGIKREFSVASTPQQNRSLVTKPHNKTPYELLIGRSPNLDFMRPFGCPVTILNTLDHLGKFEGMADEGFLVGYSVNSKAFRVFNSRTMKVEENLHIRFLENKSNVAERGPEWLFDIDSLTKSMNYEPVTTGNQTNDAAGIEINSSNDKDADEAPSKGDEGVSKGSGIDNQERSDSSTQDVNTAEQSINTANTNINTGSLNINIVVSNDLSMPSLEETSIFDDVYDDREVGTEADTNNLELLTVASPIPTTRVHKDHPKDQIIRDLNLPTQIRRMLNFSKENAMTLVDLPTGKRPIGTKWVFRNKKDERGIIVRNKARLVAQGYPQEKGNNYDKVFAPVARIEAIRLFLAYALFMGFIVYQMDVKSAFLYGIIEEEVFVCQPPGFKDQHFPDKVYKVEKALYGLHQAPRAWYETLSTYLLENRFKRGLQVKQKDNGIFISQDKYVAYILKKFDFTTVKTTSTPMEHNKALIKDVEVKDVDVHLYRLMIGSLMYLTASRPNIMFDVCACARFQVTPKTSHLHAVKRIFRYLKGQPKLGLWYPRDSPFDLEAFSDSDYAGASLDRKSITRGCQFLGKRLISWQCKKQTVVANLTTEAEYIAATSCCGHVLWIQNQMLNYGFNLMNTKIYIDNESIICIVKNPVFHSKTKHIEIRHHFIRDSYKKKLIQVIKIHTDHNVVDLFTKAFDIRALVDGKKILIIKASIRRDLRLDDAEGTACLPNAAIFEELARIGAKTTAWNEFSSTMASALICLANNQKFNFFKVGTCFSGAITPLFETMMVQAPEEVSEIPTDTQDTPILTQPSSSQLQRKHKSKRKQRKVTEVPYTEPQPEEHIPTPSHDLLPSGEDRIKLSELMEICTKLSDKVLSLEQIKTNQAAEIEKLKKRVKQLKGKKKKRTHGIKRLYKVGLTARVESSKEEEGLGDQDASKHVTTVENVKVAATATNHKSLRMMNHDGPKKPLKKKDQIALDEEVARKLEAEMKAEIEEEERIAREKNEANMAVIEEWDDVQVIIDADREDLEVLRSIVKERFKKTKPVNDMDNLLFQTLKAMFEHHVEDNI
uniref:Uncharacterized protein n=1 Tax=Tanacetum cinerariifolium TaxID=118510 RepID=A0A6L2NXB0_TANCI|nr:hypothetical protein [Tanacetum cinerariifolium]